jgi:hypothetical protein
MLLWGGILTITTIDREFINENTWHTLRTSSVSRCIREVAYRLEKRDLLNVKNSRTRLCRL